ncbi:hypothetical protein DENSPDRAFT_882330 [Dentipellis sp. KUC8613]|nr:hypothetical protein DENSPDRAFT_882330 [Dentipellis sp. KUC8613]
MARTLRILAAVALAIIAPANALWPQPRSLQTGTTALRLAPGFDIKLSIQHGSAPADLHDAVSRVKQQLSGDKLERLVVGRGAVDAAAVGKAKHVSSLTLELSAAKSAGVGTQVKSIAQEAIVPLEDRDEAYTLHVPADGSGAVITANSTLGLYRGLTTFGQLWYYHDGAVYTIEAPIQIVDSPAYPYRGFMLDTARNFFPISDIKRTLDAMSWVKINTFHWHIVDSQSFPLEVPGYTDLAQKGAYSADSVYSARDVQDIVSYAGARGIDVLLEIDTPGHTSVISKAHPEHVACAEATPWASYANEPPAGQLRFTSPSTTNYTAGLLAAAAKLSPSKLFSTRTRAATKAAASQQSATTKTVVDGAPSHSVASSAHSTSPPSSTPAPHSGGTTQSNIDFSGPYSKFAGKVDGDTLQAIRKLAMLEGQALLLQEVTDMQKQANTENYEEGFGEGQRIGFEDGHKAGRRSFLEELPERLEKERKAGFQEGHQAAHAERSQILDERAAAATKEAQHKAGYDEGWEAGRAALLNRVVSTRLTEVTESFEAGRASVFKEAAEHRSSLQVDSSTQTDIPLSLSRAVGTTTQISPASTQTAPEHHSILSSVLQSKSTQTDNGLARSDSATVRTLTPEPVTQPSFSWADEADSPIPTGGDELNIPCYDADEETQQTLNSTGQTLEQALDKFTQASHAALEKEGKTPVVWEEMVLNFNLTLSNETIVLVWISSQDAASVAQKGFRFIHSASDYFYLDCGAGGWVGANPDGNSWCEPFKTWQKSYSFDPSANLTAEEAKLVLGGQHLLWTEQSGPSNLDSIVWPRAASSAELFWSGPGGNVSTALPRLHDLAYRLKQRGVGAIALQPEWCALRPGVCDLTA